MAGSSEVAPDSSSEGIIAEASLDTLRKAAEKVLFEYVEIIERKNGEHVLGVSDLDSGDAIIFREDIDLLPAEIIAVKIWSTREDMSLWCIISTTEIPETGYPTTKDAMRVAASEEKKLRLLREFLTRETGGSSIKMLDEWKPDKRADAAKIRGIIDRATKKWGH